MPLNLIEHPHYIRRYVATIVHTFQVLHDLLLRTNQATIHLHMYVIKCLENMLLWNIGEHPAYQNQGLPVCMYAVVRHIQVGKGKVQLLPDDNWYLGKKLILVLLVNSREVVKEALSFASEVCLVKTC
jgi:hypothetical protein